MLHAAQKQAATSSAKTWSCSGEHDVLCIMSGVLPLPLWLLLLPGFEVTVCVHVHVHVCEHC